MKIKDTEYGREEASEPEKKQYTCTTQTSPAPVARSPNSRPVCARDALSQALLLTVFSLQAG
jgi:hypothetical protein